MNLKGVQFELISFIHNDGIKRDENKKNVIDCIVHFGA